MANKEYNSKSYIWAFFAATVQYHKPAITKGGLCGAACLVFLCASFLPAPFFPFLLSLFLPSPPPLSSLHASCMGGRVMLTAEGRRKGVTERVRGKGKG